MLWRIDQTNHLDAVEFREASPGHRAARTAFKGWTFLRKETD